MDIEISFLSFKLQTTMGVTEHVFVDKGIIFIANKRERRTDCSLRFITTAHWVFSCRDTLADK